MKLLVFLILATSIGFLLTPRVIKINEVSCTSQFGPCSDDLLKRFETLKGKNLKDVKSELKKILTSEMLIKSFSFRYKIPDKIQVLIIVRKPKFALINESGSAGSLVDKDGFVVEVVKSSTLPRIVTTQKLPNVGEKVDNATLFALRIIYDLAAFYQIGLGEVTGDSLVVEFSGGGKVIFPLEGDKAVLLGSLRLILSSKNNLKEIDLRFKNPVVK